jgi:protein ImuB
MPIFRGMEVFVFWAALLPDPGLTERQRTDAARAISLWCLQFTPRVALVEPASAPAAVMELEASVRLFGGKRKLVERVRAEARELGVTQISWAPTSLGAVALARAGLSNGFVRPLATILDPLPLEVLSTINAHAATLTRLGCQTLGQVRALPRGGLGRRFGADLLTALDQAYGLRPDAHAWIELPETFSARLELMSRIELAPALLFGARRLLLQLCAWLSARRAGITEFTLHWCHDAMRSKSAGDGGALTIHTATPTRDVEHLSRLLAEHLAKVKLSAPVGELRLEADEVVPLGASNASLLPDEKHDGESLSLVLERIAARLGPERVLRPIVTEDERPEWMCQWQPASEPGPRQTARRLARSAHPQPTFILPEPLRLALRESRPLYQGHLQLLMGPHRIEFGWWDRYGERPGDDPDPSTPLAGTSRHAARDYWVALSERAGLLWVFQTRLAEEQGAWFLHGIFA